MTALAAQAAVAIDNARLYQTSQREIAARRQAEQELQQLNETLEQRAEERAAQLAASLSQARGHRTAFPAACRRRHRLRDLHARSDRACRQLEPGAERIKGYAREEIIGRHFSTFYTPEDQRRGRSAKGARDCRSRPASTKPRAGGSARTEPRSGRRRHQCDQRTPRASCSALPRSRAISPNGAPPTSARGRRRRWKASARSPAASPTTSTIFSPSSSAIWKPCSAT